MWERACVIGGMVTSLALLRHRWMAGSPNAAGRGGRNKRQRTGS